MVGKHKKNLVALAVIFMMILSCATGYVRVEATDDVVQDAQTAVTEKTKTTVLTGETDGMTVKATFEADAF